MQEGTVHPLYPDTSRAGWITQPRLATRVLVITNLCMFAVLIAFVIANGDSVLKQANARALFSLGASFGPVVLGKGQVWRLVTAGFLHAGIQPLLINIAMMADIGCDTEDRFGASRMAVTYFVATVAGFAASAWYGARISAGLSPGLCGLIGSLISFGAQQRSPVGKMIMLKYSQWAFFTLLWGLVPFTQFDNAANIAGLVAGFVIGFISRTPAPRRALEVFWLCAAGACAALTIASFAAMARFAITMTTYSSSLR
jgi:rhomboid protease GluP